jgi:hypothetical protein
VFALFSLIGGMAVFVTSIILIVALRKVSTKHWSSILLCEFLCGQVGLGKILQLLYIWVFDM